VQAARLEPLILVGSGFGSIVMMSSPVAGQQRRSWAAWELPAGWDAEDEEPSGRQRRAIASSISRLTGRRHLSMSEDTLDVALAAAAEAKAAHRLNLWPELLARLRTLPPEGPHPDASATAADDGHAADAGHSDPRGPDRLRRSTSPLTAPSPRADMPLGATLVMPFTETLVDQKRLPYKTVVVLWLVFLGTAGGIGLWAFEAKQSGLTLVDVRASPRRAHGLSGLFHPSVFFAHLHLFPPRGPSAWVSPPVALFLCQHPHPLPTACYSATLHSAACSGAFYSLDLHPCPHRQPSLPCAGPLYCFFGLYLHRSSCLQHLRLPDSRQAPPLPTPAPIPSRILLSHTTHYLSSGPLYCFLGLYLHRSSCLQHLRLPDSRQARPHRHNAVRFVNPALGLPPLPEATRPRAQRPSAIAQGVL
jgi:hypothetical protein